MNSSVYTLAMDGSSSLYAGGPFTTAGGKPSAYVAIWHGVYGNPVSVAIVSFNATAGHGVVNLQAVFRSDLGAALVNVYRGDDEAGMMRVIDSVVPTRERFTFSDRSVVPGSAYRYQIGVTDPDGEFYSPVVRVTVERLVAALEQNTPNPFNPTTTIAYVLPERGRAMIRVYGADGRLVRTLVDAAQEAGPHEVTWDGRDEHGHVVSSGVYFYRLETDRFRDSKKMVLLK
jgi:hypothetical protein